MGGEREQRPLDIVSGLGLLRIGEPGAEGTLVISGELARIKPRRRTIRRGDRDPRQGPGAAPPRTSKRQAAALTGARMLVEPLRHLAGADDPHVDVEALIGLRLDGRERRVEPLAQHPELQGVEQLMHRLAVPGPEAQLMGAHRQLDGAHQLGELPVAHDGREVFTKRVTRLTGHLVHPIDQLVERAELADPLRSGLLPHSRNRGEVVGRIAPQRGEVRVLGGGQAVFRLDLGRREAGHVADAAAGHQHRDRVVDQLQRIAITGHDQHVHALALSLGSEGRDHVVGLEAGRADHRDGQRVADLANQRDLPAKVARGLRPGRLVLGVGLMTERRPALVPGHRKMRGSLIAQDIDQHRSEPVDRVRRLPGSGREVLHREGEERPIRQRMTVEQQQPLLAPFGAALGPLRRLLHRLLRRATAAYRRRGVGCPALLGGYLSGVQLFNVGHAGESRVGV